MNSVQLAIFVSEFEEDFWKSAVAFFRVAAIAYLFPGFGENVIPARVKLVMMISLALVYSSDSSYDGLKLELEPLSLLQLCLSEVSIGLFIGFVIRAVIFRIVIAGSIISQLVGISHIVPFNAASELPIASVLRVFGLLFFFSTDLWLISLTMISEMYTVLPPGALADFSAISNTVVDIANYVFRFGFILAIGFLILYTILNFFTGFCNRVYTQFPVFFAIAPLTLLFGIYFLSLHGALIFSTWVDQSREFLQGGFMNLSSSYWFSP